MYIQCNVIYRHLSSIRYGIVCSNWTVITLSLSVFPLFFVNRISREEYKTINVMYYIYSQQTDGSIAALRYYDYTKLNVLVGIAEQYKIVNLIRLCMCSNTHTLSIPTHIHVLTHRSTSQNVFNVVQMALEGCREYP